jgi:dipeptidyl aminopeptidase/acylaminoacyl peptidase
MRSRTANLPGTMEYRRYKPVFLFGLLFYTLLVLTVASFLYSRSHSTVGQLNSGDIYLGGQFNGGLDLRFAAGNQYPSSKIALTKNLGTRYGVSEKLINYKIRIDGITGYGLMMQPLGVVPAQGFPVIILCHGYTSPSSYISTRGYIEDMAFYAQHGFAVIKPDYRGQGNSKHQGEADSAYYSMAYNNDVMSLISAVKQTDYLDKSKINLWGHSMGAYIALRAAVLSSDIKNLVLLSGPVDSLDKMYLAYIPPSDENNLNALKTRSEVFSKYGIPAENNLFWRYASPINFAQNIGAKIQINQGAKDTIVPPEFSADLDKSLNAKNILHEYYVYPDGLHSLAAQRPLIWVRSLNMFESSSTSQPQAE